MCIHGQKKLFCASCKYLEVCRHYSAPDMCVPCWESKPFAERQACEIGLSPIPQKRSHVLAELEYDSRPKSGLVLPGVRELMRSADQSEAVNFQTNRRVLVLIKEGDCNRFQSLRN